MKVPTTDLLGVLGATPATAPTSRAPRQTSSRSGREQARVNELKCMRVVAHHGHVRVAELARAVWPKARYAEQVCRRVASRLVAEGLLLERHNALGSRSLCLTRVGATWLEARGIEAQHTLDLSSVSGSTFFHRTLATRYLIERQVEGFQTAGEYLLLRRKAPFPVDRMVKMLRKMPDGAVWQRRADGPATVEVCEVEAARKALPQLAACLRWAELVGQPLDQAGAYRLGGLVFVYDRELNHARRILLAATSLWGHRPLQERVTLERRVKLVAVELRDPLVWVGSSVTTLHDLRQRAV
ncbi:MAG: hypothetical protein O9335_07365 [Inhella sp.]|uniref:hypothetical protein n=1 Tax=Inhella sp. TaxID=1921806 RepID=UPI0022BFC908|nr:hypothetical protein [Inhella sp.]MCZ8234960.1 hypothetical protein [Inhella sp.]